MQYNIEARLDTLMSGVVGVALHKCSVGTGSYAGCTVNLHGYRYRYRYIINSAYKLYMLCFGSGFNWVSG
jgi:hypothetical protein